jgi:HSP20 family protein
MASKEEKTTTTVVKAAEKAKPPAKLEPRPMLTRESEIERFFDDFWRMPWPRWWRPERWGLREAGLIHPPAVDVVDEKDQIVVKVELPGLAKEDVEVDLTDTTLTIRGEKRQEKEVKEKNFHRREREYGSFSRSIGLPAEVKTSEATAVFKDGVLEVKLPKTEEAKQKKVKVPVK